MFRKTNTLPDKKQLKVQEEIVKTNITYEIPKICCYDVPHSIITSLEKMHFHVFDGSMGKVIRVQNSPGSGHCCLLNYKNPANAHEYDIFIFDMSESEEIGFDPSDHQKKTIDTDKDIYLYCSYPMNIFDPRAYSGHFINQSIQYNLSKKRLVIVFANEYKMIKYYLAEKKDRYADVRKEEAISNYSFMPFDINYKANKTGKNIKVCIKNQTLIAVLSKYIKSMEYKITFNHPTVWNGKGSEKDKNYIPLLLNEVDEIIGFIKVTEEVWTLVLPFTEKKESLINDLFMTFLPDVLPNLFPNDEKHSWKNREEYFLPNHKHLLEKEAAIKSRYEIELEEIKKKLTDNYLEYKFLHDLLTTTGDELVSSTIKYMKFLGFTSIRNMDEILSEKKEEDIQIDIPEGLLIIEVKGIGGTSRDDECSQISKIRSRRCEERNKFDVTALYIVNHQRHLPPLERKNPPFSADQEKDAVLNKRGLLTTWMLYRLYFEIINGVISKEQAIRCMLKPGIINFISDKYEYISSIEEIFKNGTVFIMRLKDITITKNDKLYQLLDDHYDSLNIESLQVDDKDVEFATNCEVGVKTSKKVKKGIKIFRIIV